MTCFCSGKMNKIPTFKASPDEAECTYRKRLYVKMLVFIEEIRLVDSIFNEGVVEDFQGQ